MSNIVAVLIVRCTHTGVYADGRPNPASVTLYDLDEITIQKNRTRAVPVPVGSFVDIPMSTRTFISWHQGDICTFTVQGLITSEIILQLRDKGNCGGPAGTGQALRPAVLNIERVGGVLRMVIPDNVIPTTLDSVGFLEGEPVTITGLTGAFRDLNGEYIISLVDPGSGLAGVDPGSYLVEVPSAGADIAAATLAGVNLCLSEGRVVAQFGSSGDVGGLGTNVFGYIGGQTYPNAGGGGGALAVFDEGVLIDAAVTTMDFIGAGVTASSAGAGLVDITIPGGATSLQTAYEGGNTIVTDTTNGDLDVSGTEAISLDASAASNFTVAGANLDLRTTGSGNINVISADDVIMQADNLDLDAVNASASLVAATTLELESQTGDMTVTSGSDIFVDAVDNVEINSSAGLIAIGNDAATGAINVGTGAAARTITIGNSTGATGVDIDTGTGALDITSTNGEAAAIVSFTTTGASGDSIEFFVGDSNPSGTVTGLAGSLFFRDTGTGAELFLNTSTGSGTTWTQISIGGGAGLTLQQAYQNGNTIVTSATEGDFDVSGTEAVSLDAGATSNFTVVGANLTLETTTSGDVLVDSAGATTVRGTTAVTVAGDTVVDASAVDVTVQGASSSGAANDGGDVVLNTGNPGAGGTAGTIRLRSPSGGEADPLAVLETLGTDGDSVNLFVGDNDPDGSVTGLAGSVFFRDTGTTGELYLNTSTGSGTTWEQVVTEGTLVTETFTSGEALTAGDLVTLDSAGDAVRANSSIGSAIYEVIGVSAETVGIGVPVRVVTHSGEVPSVRFTAAPGAASNGQLVFLSTSSGLASTTPPGSGGNAYFTIGTLQGADGVTTTPTVVFRPQLIALRS